MRSGFVLSCLVVSAIAACLGIVWIASNPMVRVASAAAIGLLSCLLGLRWGELSHWDYSHHLERLNRQLGEQNDALAEMNRELLSDLDRRVSDEHAD